MYGNTAQYSPPPPQSGLWMVVLVMRTWHCADSHQQSRAGDNFQPNKHIYCWCVPPHNSLTLNTLTARNYFNWLRESTFVIIYLTLLHCKFMLCSNSPFKSSLVWYGPYSCPTGFYWVLLGPTGGQGGYGGHGGLPAAAARLRGSSTGDSMWYYSSFVIVNLVEFKPLQTCNFDLRLKNSFCVNFELRL